MAAAELPPVTSICPMIGQFGQFCCVNLLLAEAVRYLWTEKNIHDIMGGGGAGEQNREM